MRSTHRSNRRGFTLLEVLVATAVTLLMMIALAQIFKIIGDSMKQGRAALQMNNTLRSVAFRLRHDLNNLTVRVDPPADGSSGTGYFEYYDGPMTDYSLALFDPNNGLNYPKITTDPMRSSRFGDLDDILMYTARAGDAWFTGKVPQFILNGTNPSGAADFNLVTISAQHAEIAVFARPIDADGNGVIDDTDGDTIPDGYQLFYRTLLIRPDLNDPPGVPADGMLPFSTASGNPWLVASSQSPLPSPAYDMALAHQQCDLSLRRVTNGSFSSNGFDRVAANSLEDLMDPANRFAHARVPVPNSTSSVTMPLLALDQSLNVFDQLYSNSYFNNGIGSGFLNQAFILGRLVSSAIDDVRLGEDLFASDLLAFDAKGFDAAAPIMGIKGADGLPTPLTVVNFGAAGSDDVTLTPNDPGFGAALAAYASGDAIAIGSGAFVDLMWGHKTLCALPYFNLNASNLPNGILMPGGVAASTPEGNYLATELSGFGLPAANWNNVAAPGLGILPFSRGLTKSGKAVHALNATVPLFLQPTYDSWTTRYESDGATQAELSNNTGTPILRGVVNINGFSRLYNSSSTGSDIAKDGNIDRIASPDAGSDGIDNNGTGGVDEITEQETSAPFPVRMRGVKVSIRIEDKPTRQVKQMSVASEFVTQ